MKKYLAFFFGFLFATSAFAENACSKYTMTKQGYQRCMSYPVSSGVVRACGVYSYIAFWECLEISEERRLRPSAIQYCGFKSFFPASFRGCLKSV